MSWPTLQQLRYFVAIADSGSFSVAADQQFVSQPALSAQIKELERKLGVTLFERTNRGVLLTTHGAEVLKRARVVLREVVGLIEATMHDGKRLRGEIGLGVIPTFAPYILPDVVRSFKAARQFVHSQRIADQKEWMKWCKGELRHRALRPADIPVTPDSVYRDKGWKGWRDWLGTPVPVLKRQYRQFHEARAFVHRLKLANSAEWYAYSRGRLAGKPRRPSDIPSAPHYVYEDSGWRGMRDWLGTPVKRNRKSWRSFSAARSLIHRIGLQNIAEWHAYSAGKLRSSGSRPEDIPSAPHLVYRNDGWRDYSDWLGTDRKGNARRRR